MKAPVRTTIRVGSAPPRFQGEALALDGRVAEPLTALIAIDEAAGALVIQPRGQAPWVWPLSEVRTIPGQADRETAILGRQGDPLARLHVADPEAGRILLARCPNLRKRPRPRGLARLAAWAVAAVAAVALIVFVMVPLLADRLAELLPPEGEQALGDATLEQVRVALDRTGLNPLPVCDAEGGQAALDAMAARLGDGVDLPYELRLSVLDHPLVNAFALPGGRVVFFRGLIHAAETPEELAAVLAHEIGHVAARDPTRIALQSAGSIGVLGMLFGDFAGGALVLFLTERLIQARYSQAAEAAADVFAVKRLQAAGVDPAALARFFERLREKHGDADTLAAHFLSHPTLGDRIAASAAAEAPDPLVPLLDADGWAALRGICDAGAE